MFESLNIIKEMVYMQYATMVKFWMHLDSFGTQGARVTHGFWHVQLLCFFHAEQPPMCILNLMVAHCMLTIS